MDWISESIATCVAGKPLIKNGVPASCEKWKKREM
jgi:hypothetical protein